MEFYKRVINPKDFQTVVNVGQPEFPYLLNNQISIRILLTQTIKDIGYYESYKEEKESLVGIELLSNFDFNF